VLTGVVYAKLLGTFTSCDWAPEKSRTQERGKVTYEGIIRYGKPGRIFLCQTDVSVQHTRCAFQVRSGTKNCDHFVVVYIEKKRVNRTFLAA
jgi:hypothetical protein